MSIFDRDRTEAPNSKKWGLVCETDIIAKEEMKDGGMPKTGLDKYLETIFHNVYDWVHDKNVPTLRGTNFARRRPNYRSETLKMVVEYDDYGHYKSPIRIAEDAENEAAYRAAGYKVVRVPYFIQLTNEVVKQMFGVDVEEPLFDPTVPSISPEWQNTPAYLTPSGVRRMAKEFKKYPQQYKVNIEHLRTYADDTLTECKWLSELVEATE